MNYYLNVKNSLHGVQIPLPFSISDNFGTSACHKHYDIYAGTKIYRGLQEKNLIPGTKRDLIDEILDNR